MAGLEIMKPGDKIREELRVRDMLQKEFATRMGLTEKHVSKLINGEVQLTVDVAVRLETVLGVPAAQWNAMEASYREALIRKEYEAGMEAEIDLAQCIPYGEMAGLGWVSPARTMKEKVANLRAFFELTDLTLIDTVINENIACHKLNVWSKEDMTLLTWIQAARRSAQGNEAGPLNAKEIEKMAGKLRGWTKEKPAVFLPKLMESLSKNGILLVFLPRIKGLFVQSVSFQVGNKVIIAMTAKKMDDNEFWMRLTRELAHVYLGHVWQESGTNEQDEVDATTWAKNLLLPRKKFDAFVEAGSYTEKSTLQYAEKQGVAPGIVIGRMQREGMIGSAALNRLKANYDLTKYVALLKMRGEVPCVR